MSALLALFILGSIRIGIERLIARVRRRRDRRSRASRHLRVQSRRHVPNKLSELGR